MPYIHWNLTWLFIIYILPITVEAIPWHTRADSLQLVSLVTYVKYLNSDLIINIWRKTEMEKEREELDWMKDFKVERRDLKLC